MAELQPVVVRTVLPTPRLLVKLAAGVGLVIATLLLAAAFNDRRLPDLETWHRSAPQGEFRANDAVAGFGLDDHLRLEDRLFAQLSGYAIKPGDQYGCPNQGRGRSATPE
jgi:hypothetical protein